jgi:hypothetical protein
MIVSEVNIIPVKPEAGLIGFASCVVNGQLYLGSLGIHKRLDGSGYRITYPTKRIGKHEVNFYNPITKHAGCVIEKAVVAKCVELFERSDENHGRHSKTTNTNS